MSKKEKKYNSHSIITQFGLESKVFENVMKILKVLAAKSENLYNKHYESWYSHFKNLYGVKITHDLFLKHSYYSIVLKFLLMNKLRKINNQKEACTLYKRLFSEEEVLFNWVDSEEFVNMSDFISPEDMSFSHEDLFHELYQEVFLSETRHKIGEFYTSSTLVKEMVDDSYKLGNKVLDPSCGSGTFLIGIILKLIRAPLSKDKKLEFINYIFGFDVNPLAVLTAKTNLLLILIDFLDNEKIPDIKLNVFLMDSFVPRKINDRTKN